MEGTVSMAQGNGPEKMAVFAEAPAQSPQPSVGVTSALQSMNWLEKLSLVRSLGSDVFTIIEALQVQNPTTASHAFVDVVVHVVHAIGVKGLPDDRVTAYSSIIESLVDEILKDVAAKK